MMNDVVVCLFSILLLGLGYVNVRGKVSTGEAPGYGRDHVP